MSADTHADMHEEHRRWQNETAMWHDDIGVWQAQYRKALADLSQLQAALSKHLFALENHERSIHEHENHLREHERALAAFKQGQHIGDLELLTAAKAHQEERARHACQREYHERAKKEYHTAMVNWSPLLKEIARSAHVHSCGG